MIIVKEYHFTKYFYINKYEVDDSNKIILIKNINLYYN
jgi:hypothetical protein